MRGGGDNQAVPRPFACSFVDCSNFVEFSRIRLEFHPNAKVVQMRPRDVPRRAISHLGIRPSIVTRAAAISAMPAQWRG